MIAVSGGGVASGAAFGVAAELAAPGGAVLVRYLA